MNIETSEQPQPFESGRLDIEGSDSDFSKGRVQLLVPASVAFGLSLLLFYGAFGYFEDDGVQSGCGFFGLVALSIALLFLSQSHEYIELGERKIIKQKKYLGFETSRVETPLSSFSKIVVRHVCHPGGEGEDTFTGSVGLKPATPGPVLWVKEFPATKDEMTMEPDLFARELSKRIGLPYSGHHAANLL